MSVAMLFLKLDFAGKPVPGEATHQGHEGQVELTALDWGMAATDHKPSKDARKLDAELRPRHLTLSKYFDKATPNLCLHMKNRAKFTSATITMLSGALVGKEGTSPKVTEMVLKDGYVESVTLDAGSSGKAMAVTERVVLSFNECKLMYHPADPGKHARLAPTTFEMKLPANKHSVSS